MASERLHITELESRTITRARGHMAYESLVRHLQDDQPIEIDLSGEQPLSLSFLDEIVRLLADSGRLGQITFVVDRPETLHKLGRVADVRQVDFHVLEAGAKQRKTVERVPAARPETIVVGVKPTGAPP